MVDASTRWIRPAARRSGSTFAPRRHRRTSSSPVRTAGVVATAVAGLLFFVFALFAAAFFTTGAIVDVNGASYLRT